MDNSFLLPNSSTFLPSPTKTLYLWVVPIYLPSTTFFQLLETTPIFSVFLWICQIWTFHINGIIQHVVSCIWLLSLIIMLSELLCVAFYGHIIFNKRNQRSSCQHPLDHRKAREFQKNIYFCFIDSAKTVWITTNYEIFLKRWEYQTTLPASWETWMQSKKS